MGQRNAFKRLGHLICVMFVRVRAVGLSDDLSFEFPVIQAKLAETSGPATVHTIRIPKELLAAGLIALQGRHLTILDFNRLVSLSKFNPNDLHLECEYNKSAS